VTSYRIFRSASGSPATSGTPVATVSSNSHTWTDTNTNNGTTYSYIVQAWYSFSGGTLQGDAESNVVTATPDPPSAVQDLTGTPGFGAVDLNWDSVDPNALDVVIYRSDTSGDLGDAIVTLNDTSVMTYVDPGPLSGTYYYTVRTESAGGYQDANVTVTVGP
jgi:hypothetical protein